MINLNGVRHSGTGLKYNKKVGLIDSNFSYKYKYCKCKKLCIWITDGTELGGVLRGCLSGFGQNTVHARDPR
jgi:hypothetical protein